MSPRPTRVVDAHVHPAGRQPDHRKALLMAIGIHRPGGGRPSTSRASCAAVVSSPTHTPAQRFSCR